MKSKIKVGIIGFGLSGRYFFAPYIEYHPGFSLFAFCSSQKQAIADEYPNAKVFSKVDDLIESDNIDLLIVASPNHTHFNYARKAMLAGKHVIVEKPFTITTAEATELIALSEQMKVVLAPFHNRRWDGDFLTVQQIIAEGKLGQVLNFESRFDRYRPLYERAPWKNDPIAGNGILYDLGPHLIDQALVLFGKPEAIFANIGVQRINGPIDDNFEIQLYYPQLKVVLKAGAIVREQGPRFEVHGRNGSFVKHGLDPQEAQLKEGMKPSDNELGQDNPNLHGLLHTEIDGKVIREQVASTKGSYTAYFNNVYDAITHNSPLIIKPHDAMMVIHIIEKAYQSNKLKKVIDL